jgi:chemotaxis protein histidine kinase CheA
MANADELKKQIESLQKNLGSKEANAEALDKLKKELQKAQQAAANMMAKGSQAADAAKDSLAKALASLSRQAQDLGATLPSLEEAISALEASKIDQVMKDLEVAEKDLEKMEQMAQSLQQLQQQAAQMGKDLAEQLDKGQAEAAAATLRKLSDQLKAGKLAPEQLKAIADEVAKAIKPAGPYGKVPDLLKQAARQMQQGQTPGASQSLADAAKELDALMQQMADAQDLKDTLDALKRAQLCVGTCQGWGQCKSDKLGYKPGGKPGSGVGDWAGDTPPSEAPENTGLWDNSGVERPDKNPRGQTDRGAGDLPPGLTPTKVKGQFTPGSQMPSITLKGVSIKGQSTVAFQQAVTAAQSEAQAALSQEQVPRAYQGAVKDYFDDLKK